MAGGFEFPASAQLVPANVKLMNARTQASKGKHTQGGVRASTAPNDENSPTASQEEDSMTKENSVTPQATALPTLISAMKVLARDIESPDGVANAAIAEAAQRLHDLEDCHMLLGRIVYKFGRATNMGQLDEIMSQARGFIARKGIANIIRSKSPNDRTEIPRLP